jgi:hypothetical protein
MKRKEKEYMQGVALFVFAFFILLVSFMIIYTEYKQNKTKQIIDFDHNKEATIQKRE